MNGRAHFFAANGLFVALNLAPGDRLPTLAL